MTDAGTGDSAAENAAEEIAEIESLGQGTAADDERAKPAVADASPAPARPEVQVSEVSRGTSTSDQVTSDVSESDPTAEIIITEDRGSLQVPYSPEDIATAMERALEGYGYIKYVSLRRKKLIFKVAPEALNSKTTAEWLTHILDILDTAGNVVVSQAMTPLHSDGIALAPE